MTNREVIRATYEGPSEENGKHLLAALAPDATWTEAAVFPYAGTYTGPEEIVAKVFRRLGHERASGGLGEHPQHAGRQSAAGCMAV